MFLIRKTEQERDVVHFCSWKIRKVLDSAHVHSTRAVKENLLLLLPSRAASTRFGLHPSTYFIYVCMYLCLVVAFSRLCIDRYQSFLWSELNRKHVFPYSRSHLIILHGINVSIQHYNGGFLLDIMLLLPLSRNPIKCHEEVLSLQPMIIPPKRFDTPPP